MLIKRGQVVFSGTSAETVQQYRRAVAQPVDGSRPKADIGIASVQILDRDGGACELFETGRPMTIRIGYETSATGVEPGIRRRHPS